ncbi:MAG: hypothetical protein A3I88_03915 [Candidatus Portnoybacteria bacterium RIFCSPLOWO2_12_FULL_39_9]|uniref:NTF2-like N-terminal transpeptidase domain-containing protein n=1 Tax=Candidatus Portnoybacteria bacterium RIFCSPHIGHO2_12_FULL_38_9 TaxID=1801997 RepID=A0A1G2FEG6_9BACT|nr:MAG: hypothetical protein A3H00_02955 [Candidatus Portnoybacteria bacterium RBG_13_40_8]OGZ35921.1 MAG: hypothetical protein A2646_01935 [Candidatus Portnoybacteria bacterium RIFCSPHIGHO2_02_FULL_39_12]OGZ36443.1 MAG: hypothetical protein A3J64_02325 [Candidatus Portnoybacteria bacterium RIFCSPHIGHO2_12_FULL_38_9]OGZ40256.1 MAG: hypothetical protein A3I88_03915 [Candidatus Portnoybacteria bacterium RIFCSPLOWO2_12_FULL_39_9]
MSPEEWGKQIQSALAKIRYEHLGGKITKEKINGSTAIVVVKAVIAAVDGISTQVEIYLLKHIGEDWLIDGLLITEEIPLKPEDRWSYWF